MVPYLPKTEEPKSVLQLVSKGESQAIYNVILLDFFAHFKVKIIQII